MKVNCYFKRTDLKFFIIFSLIGLYPNVSSAQKSMEVYGTLGSTLVDVDKLSGLDGTDGIRVADYETLAYGFSLQVFPIGNETLSVGAEYGYNYLLYYTYLVGQSLFVKDVESYRVMLITRIAPKKKLLLESGAGVHFVNEVTEFAMAFGGGYKLKLAENLYFPLKLRADLIFTENTPMVPVTLNGGLSYSF